MALLHLLSITCDRRDDTVGKDKPMLKVDGVTVWSGTGFSRGESAPLSTVAPRPFPNTGVVAMELWEQDAAPNPDDFLGRVTISADVAGSGSRTANFTQSSAEYRVIYRVS
jgi:hypothetical protein